MKQFPTSYEIPCIYPQLQHSASTVFVDVPGSKSITNRALLLATLADGTSTLKGVLFSDDSRHFLSCIQALGFETQVDEKKAIITIKGENGRIPLKEASQYVAPEPPPAFSQRYSAFPKEFITWMLPSR